MKTTWTLIHDNDSRIEVDPSASLKLALESGYRWVNRGDGNGWKQLSWLLKRVGR